MKRTGKVVEHEVYLGILVGFVINIVFTFVMTHSYAINFGTDHYTLSGFFVTKVDKTHLAYVPIYGKEEVK